MGVPSETATAVAGKTLPCKKVRIKLLAKKPATGLCSNPDQVLKVNCLKKSSLTDDCRTNTAVNKKPKSATGVKHVIGVSQSSKVKCLEKSSLSTEGIKSAVVIVTSNSILGKRRSEQLLECEKGKRLKMDRFAAKYCRIVLSKLMKHPYAKAFLEPVNPEFWGIHDYFDIIKHPMDLGTINRKLQQNTYVGAEEFEADVRLTFDNAMLYNSPNIWVHQYAKELSKMFESLWKSLKARMNRNHQNTKQRSSENGVGKFVYDAKGKCLESTSSETDTLSGRTMLHKENYANEQKKVSVEVQSKDFKAVKDQSAKGSKPSRPNKDFAGPVSHPDKESSRALPAKSQLENIPGDKLQHKEFNAVEVKNTSTLQMGRSDQDSEGDASCVDEEHNCASFPTTAGFLGATTTSLETVLDIELSPSKALRAAKLKSRFADTILKAQAKTLLQPGGGNDAVTSQQEKERLERKLHEEKARIEAQIRAAESAARLKAERELKKQRQQAREEARAALEKMERSIDLDDNFHTMKDLEALIGSSSLVVCHDGKSRRMWNQNESGKQRSPLEKLGLYLKAEYRMGDDDDGDLFLQDRDVEEGELVC